MNGQAFRGLARSAGQDFSKARDYAYRLLDVRPRSIKELDERLERKGFSKEVRSGLVEYLKERDYLNDEEFARIWVNYRTSSKPTGPHLLRYELKKKGVDNELIDKVLAAEYEAKFSQACLVREAVETRLKLLKGLDEQTKKRRLLAYLTRRGFSYEIAREVIGEKLR